MSKYDNLTKIAVAIIGLAGVLGAAVIANTDKFFPSTKTSIPSESSKSSTETSIQPSATSPVSPVQEFDSNVPEISGLWVGRLTQNTEPRMWNIKMIISQEGQLLEGSTTKEPITNELASVQYEFKGLFSNPKLTFSETFEIQRNAPQNSGFCNISAELELITKEYDKLIGSWECTYQGKRYFGEIVLNKQ